MVNGSWNIFESFNDNSRYLCFRDLYVIHVLYDVYEIMSIVGTVHCCMAGTVTTG